jgi:glycerophosphoryl diester phosphodiesterase
MKRLPSFVLQVLFLTACGSQAVIDDTGGPAPRDSDSNSNTDSGTAVLGPAAPSVVGELDCGHANPIWLWSFSESVTAVRHRLDSGPWITATVQDDRFQAQDLVDGSHVFEVQGRVDNSQWSESGEFETVITIHRINDGYWAGVARKITATPLGHAVGVNCHNCYEDGAGNAPDNLTDTANLLDDAIRNGADFLELDVKVQDGTWYVAHDEDGDASGATAADVLALPVLKASDAPIFLELKEREPTLGQVGVLVQMLIDEGYGVNGRPVVLRTFPDRIANFTYATTALEDHPFHAPYFRYHLLYGTSESSSTAGFQALLQDAATMGMDGVEMGLKTPDLFTLIHTAENLGLGVGLWTVPESMGEVFCVALREEVDALTTDYPVDDCSQVIQEDSQILYLDASRQTVGATQLDYFYDGSSPGSVDLTGSDKPSLVDGAGRSLVGSALEFDSAAGQSLAFFDGDNDPDEGYFVVAVMQPDVLTGSDWDTQAIVSKADSGGFALELDSSPSNVLRFGVRVASAYEYATKASSGLSATGLHFVMGAYDGNGKVRLWLDASDSGVSESGDLSGGVIQNDSPIRIGADPEGASGSRFHFDGALQMISVHKWRNH